MFEQMGIFSESQLFELFKLYTEKQLNAIGAGNKELEIACDKGRAACVEGIDEARKVGRF